MSTWMHQWAENGWRNSRGGEVVNGDLIREARGLDDAVRELGKVKYVWIRRSENWEADEAADLVMDEMEEYGSF